MKKYLFIAAAALLALAACSKVVPVETPDQEISFQVANYATATKGDPVTLINEFDHFYTYAIFTPAEGDKQLFMDKVEIKASPATTAVTKWTPERTYYWPKTGSINFYSYIARYDAGGENGLTPTTAPSLTQEAIMEFANLTIEGGTPEVAAVAADPENGIDAVEAVPAKQGDNILVANPALNQTANVDDPYEVDQSLNPKKGVPTLFNHALAKIVFKVQLDASALAEDPNTTWTVDIAPQELTQVPNQGTLTVTYVQSLVKPTIAWTVLNNSTKASVNAKATTLSVTSNGKTDPTDLLTVGEFVVIPQVYSALPFKFKFRLTNTYNSGETGATDVNVVETYTVPTDKTLADFVPNVTDVKWLDNHVYTYTIVIKPNEPIYFVPAVTDWDSQDAGTYGL